MKIIRDLEKKILFYVEERDHEGSVEKILIDGYTIDQIEYHAAFLVESNLLKGIEVTTIDDKFTKYLVSGLTVNGHKTIDWLRGEKR